MTPAEEALTIARIALLLKQPFFGMLAMNLEIIEVTEEQAKLMKTAAVDGRHLWYNPDFINSLDKEEVMFLVGHEVMHCVFNHLKRRFDRDPKIYNMAADYVINGILVEAGMKMPKIGLLDENYHNWTSEDVYDHLIENKCESKPTLDCHAGDPGFPGEDGEGDSDSDSDDSEGGDGKAAAGKARELEDEWKDHVIQAAAAAAGNVPAGLQRLISDLVDPKMDWRQLIQVHLQSCVRTDYDWMRPNKRTFGMGITMPSMKMDDMIEIAVAVDTSGSVSPDMLKDFLSEIKGIMDAFSGYKIHIACFDTQIYNYQCFTQEDDLMEYEMDGFGGTDFMAWWNFAKDQDWIGDIQKILFFTDGYPYGEWGIDDLCETLWIIHGSRNEGPFGVTVFYEDHLKDQN